MDQVTSAGSVADSRFGECMTNTSSGAATAYVPIFVNANATPPSARTLTWSTSHMIWTSPGPPLLLENVLTDSM